MDVRKSVINRLWEETDLLTDEIKTHVFAVHAGLCAHLDSSPAQRFVYRRNNRLAIKCYITTMETFGSVPDESGILACKCKPCHRAIAVFVCLSWHNSRLFLL